MRWLLASGLLFQMAMTPKLWGADRAFPTVPLPGLPNLPHAWAVAASLGLALALVAFALSPLPRWPVAAALGFAAVLVIFDINRLQPWLYQYALMMGGFLVVGKRDDSLALRRAWGVGAIVVAAIYFWSGVHKFNPVFAQTVFPWLMGPLGKPLGPYWSAAPAIEALIGVMLLWPRTRIFGLVGAVGMHVFLLAALGPLGHNYNPVVWPWNVWMAAIAAALFLREPSPVPLRALRTAPGLIVSLLAAAAPALHLFGRWDSYLSASLYSGRPKIGYVFFHQEVADALPPGIRRHVAPAKGGIPMINLPEFAMKDMGAPAYPEIWVYREVARSLGEQGVPHYAMALAVSPPFDRPQRVPID